MTVQYEWCGTWVCQNHSYLGIQLDNIMSLNALIKDIKKKISNKIFVFRKIRIYLNFHAAVLVYKQTISCL